MISKYKIFSDFLASKITASSTVKTGATFNTSKTTFLEVFKTVAQKELSSLQIAEVATSVPKLVSLKKEVKLCVPNLIQGHNECGPTSLAMIMKYYGIDPGNYHNMFSSDTVGHSPLALKEKAQTKNLTVRQANYGTLEDLAALVDMGIPPLVLGIYGGGNNASLADYISNASRAHWMVVTGYKTDETGKITHIYFNNPNCSTPQCWTASDFLNKFWNNNIIPGGHRYFMAMAPRNNSSWSFQEAALRRFLPQDKISSAFKATLETIHELEEAFYASERAANTVAEAAKDAWNEVCSWFS